MAFVIALGISALLVALGMLFTWASIVRTIKKLWWRYLQSRKFHAPPPAHEYHPLLLYVDNPEAVNIDEIVFVQDNPFKRKRKT